MDDELECSPSADKNVVASNLYNEGEFLGWAIEEDVKFPTMRGQTLKSLLGLENFFS